jgi:hypothetical protein
MGSPTNGRRALVGPAATTDDRRRYAAAVTFAAWAPLGPWTTSNSTF